MAEALTSRPERVEAGAEPASGDPGARRPELSVGRPVRPPRPAPRGVAVLDHHRPPAVEGDLGEVPG
ncbi:hypothetical protein ACFYO5_08795 [Streptomyces sp. NPDC006259]|uniref:hypothetical protein n=1 Tax=Streptomyces sp. NPDC006259 TaxID=3364740 RepID=UPI003676FA32